MKFLSILCVFCTSFTFSQVQNITLLSEKCAHVTSLSPSANFANGTLVTAGRTLTSSSYYTERTYVEIDLSSIPVNAVIVSAQLKLKVQTTSPSVPTILADRVGASWAENSITWSTKPSSAVDVLSSTVTSDWLVVDVKNHVQRMVVKALPNYGWVLYHQNEVENAQKYRTFCSDDYTGTDSDPRIEITYYIPLSVTNATVIIPESAASQNDGSISPVLAQGNGGTYGYQWFNASGTMTGRTSLDLTDIPSGWYGLRAISTSPSVDTFYYAFLVGINCEDVDISFSPGPNFIDDALISTFASYLYLNLGTNTTIRSETWTSGGTWYETRTLLGFRLYIDPTLVVSAADMTLYGNAHNPLSRANDSELQLVTEYWNEKNVTKFSNTLFSNTIIADVPSTTSANQNSTISIKDFWRYWQDNPTSNYGMLFKLDTYLASYTKHQYHSSDVVNTAQHPKINFKVRATSECRSHSEMKRALDGGFSYAISGKLKFSIDEEYEVEDFSMYLPFRIYDKDHIVLESSDIDGMLLNGSVPPLPLKFDDNRWTLNVSLIPGMTVGEYYILEVSNSKGDKRYLRFLYKN